MNASPPQTGSPESWLPVHVTVCVCTFRREELLARLLRTLESQEMRDRLSLSVIVVDNDRNETARETVRSFGKQSRVPVEYRVEPEQNIALARNRAIQGTGGTYLAFIDDDEEPSPDWLMRLAETIELYGADGVLGPVLPRFLTPPPDWIVRGRFFDRPSLPTGTWLRWNQARTGNALFRRRIFDDPGNRFRPEYGRGGEDRDFFRRMIAKGMHFVWCAEAPVYETVPPERCRHEYLLKRALLRGMIPYNQGWPVAKSVVAAPAYALALPFFLPFGHHVFMRYLIKECDHLGRILAFLHMDVIKERYLTR